MLWKIFAYLPLLHSPLSASVWCRFLARCYPEMTATTNRAKARPGLQNLATLETSVQFRRPPDTVARSLDYGLTVVARSGVLYPAPTENIVKASGFN